jgi:hypothetical protein
MKFTITDNQFPVTDEQGSFLGLYLKVLSTPASNYLFRIDTPAAQNYGFTAALTIELDTPAYINGLHLEPVAGYPFHLLQIQTDGLTAPQGQQLFSGDIVVDRAASIRFPSTLVHRLYLTFRQENYDFKQYTIDPADAQRRDALLTIQSFLPFAGRRVNITQPIPQTGAQYEIALANISAEATTVGPPQDCGVLVNGPFAVNGLPELIRFDANWSGSALYSAPGCEVLLQIVHGEY